MEASSDPSTTDIEEKTEVIYGEENIIRDTIELIPSAKKCIDACMDPDAPSTFVIPNHPITKVFVEAKARGIQIRFISEIRKENIEYCKKLMAVANLRHLDEVKGNFGIVDGIYYRATAKAGKSSAPPLLLSTSISAFVQQQQYFFDTLWRKSIPALQRIKEIEENLKREFIETIRDSDETESLILKVLSSSTEEIQLIFSSVDSLNQFFELGILNLIVDKAKNGIVVRILIGTNSSIDYKDLELLTGFPKIEIRYLNKSVQTRITTIITDRELSLIIEESEMMSPYDIGLATYSNSDSTVFSYVSIFENLWMQSTTTILS